MFVVVVTFLNEERLLPVVLESVAEQTRPADRVLLVDDGSTDSSPAIAAEFARRVDGAALLRRPRQLPARDRLAGASELRAFQWAVGLLDSGWDVVGKLDADVRLSPQVFAELQRSFDADPRLGIAGAYLSEVRRDGAVVRNRTRPEHVNGATKFYRRECYEQLAPMPAIIGWDMIDTAAARRLGWRTTSLEVPGGDPLHLRPMGSHAGALRSWRRWGRGAYAMGEPALHVLLHSVQRMVEPPPVLGGLNYAAGWALGLLGRAPRAQPDVRAYVRADQLRRVRRRLRALGRRLDPVP